MGFFVSVTGVFCCLDKQSLGVPLLELTLTIMQIPGSKGRGRRYQKLSEVVGTIFVNFFSLWCRKRCSLGSGCLQNNLKFQGE